jgi:integrase
VEAFGYHDIRHTVAKYLNDVQKVGLKKFQQVLRHRRQTTTEIYVEGNYTDTKDALSLLEQSNIENPS